MSARWRVGPDDVEEAVCGFFDSAEKRSWGRLSFPWRAIDAGRLKPADRSALRFVTFIEDHVPGYFAEYQRRFPVDAAENTDDYLHNRELYRFTARWAAEEDAHAHVFSLYQRFARMASSEELREELAAEGRKPFVMDCQEPIQVFTYTLLQEKATQIFYQHFCQATAEPVLRQILRCVIRDEARHFAFFANLVERYLRRYGDALLPQMRDVMAGFKMPLAESLRDYWRWSLRVADALGGYDHRSAFPHLERIVQRAAHARSTSRTSGPRELLAELAALGSQRAPSMAGG
jgi:acyl-[acyl-carrier-protein] desaturase